jgi:hypothetical protein
MANFSGLTKLREIGLNSLVRPCVPRRPLGRFTREGCYSPPLLLAERHSLVTAPQPQPRSVPIARAKHKRQSHFNLKYLVVRELIQGYEVPGYVWYADATP